ncbi:MAG: AbrB/MazE/SpoVT family DNA-binding domain-containing protein [Pseudomonadota bacterium]
MAHVIARRLADHSDLLGRLATQSRDFQWSLIATAFCSNSAILQYMKATVTITSRGVITLPAKLRQALGLKAEDHLIAETTPEGLLLRPAVTLPVEMYTPERVREFDAAEQELAAYLGAKAPALKRAARPKRKSAR